MNKSAIQKLFDYQFHWRKASWLYIVTILICTLWPFDFVFSKKVFFTALQNIEWTSPQLLQLTGDPIQNILFFMPFGYFIHKLLSTRPIALPMASIIAITIGTGLLFSFVIESGQLFIESRVTSFIDIIANTSGSALGAVFARSPIRQFVIMLFK